MRDVFESVGEIDGYSLGQNYTLDGLEDIYAYNDKLYLLCGKNSKIIVLDKDYKVISEIFATHSWV